MLKAKDIMTPNPVTITPETEILAAVKMLLDTGYNGLPVVDRSHVLRGILCQSDLIAQQKALQAPAMLAVLDGFIPLSSSDKMDKEIQKICAATVAEAMTPNPVTITPDTSVEDIASLMVDKKYHTLPVVKDGKLVGIVGKEDLLRTILPTDELKK